jgi:hypothetical protein
VSTIPPISTKQKKVETVMVNNSTNINKAKESLNSVCFVHFGGIVDYHCLSFLLFCWYWMNCWPSLFKLSYVLFILEELLTITIFFAVMVNNSTNINKTKERLNSDGRQFHQYEQNKRKFKQWWSTIPTISTNWWNCWPSLFQLSFVLFILEEMLTITV